MNFDNFAEELFKALGRALYFILGAPTPQKDFVWADFLLSAFVKITIICILLLLFYAIYRISKRMVGLLAARLQVNQKTTAALISAIKYFWWFASMIVVISQLGVSYVFIKSLVRAVFVGAFFYLSWILLTPFLEKTFAKYELNASVKQLVHNVSSVLIFVFAIAALMKQFGFDLVSIVAGLGIVGIAVGFAAQSTLADFIAGITILVEQPFQIGDWVSINTQTGKVERISLRTTHIRTRENISVIIPNAKVASAEVTNLSARKLSAYHAAFSIAHEADIDKARELIVTMVRQEFDLVLNQPIPSIRITALAESRIEMILFYWIAAGNIDKQALINAELLEAIKKTLHKENIKIPYPHMQLVPHAEN